MYAVSIGVRIVCEGKKHSPTRGRASGLVAALLLSIGMSAVQATASNNDEYWQEHLRYSYFTDREVIESEDVVQLQIPKLAEDPTTVPVSIQAMMPQTDERYIKQVSLFIDNNPTPLAGRFNFTPKSGHAHLRLRVRVAERTAVRAVAELNDGSLHMSRRYIVASGGCSAPIQADLEKAMSRLGKMKLNVASATVQNKPLSTKLRIRHPNITGMQTVGGEFVPARYIKDIKVSYDGDLVFSAQTDISVSADPTFGFYFVSRDDNDGEMIAEVTDSAGETFTKTISVAGRAR